MPIFQQLVTLEVLSDLAVVIGVVIAQPPEMLTVLFFPQLLVQPVTCWNFGLLVFLIILPQFSCIHHSTLPGYSYRNFGGALAIWAHLFGIDAPLGHAPIHLGLVHEREPESFFSRIFVHAMGILRLLTGGHDAASGSERHPH